MASQPRAPTSKLLDLIRTGSLPQDNQRTSDTAEEPPVEEPTKAAPISPEAGEETEKKDNIVISSGFYKVPNIIDDHIVGDLSMPEEVVYRHIIRLSWGWNRNWCRVGTNYFLQKSSLKSRKSIKNAILRLLDRELIMCHIVKGKIDRNQDGTTYIVPLPRERGVLSNSTLPNSILHNSTLGVLSDSTLQDTTPELNSHELPIQGGVLLNSVLPNSRITDTLTDISKDTLSPRAIISGFYNRIGQTKTSKEKRERALIDLKELEKDGFGPEDIQFAVEWTVKNAKEELYDFSIIKHTIGQAMAAKKKTEAEKVRQLEEERLELENQVEEEKQAEEQKRMEALKGALDPGDRANLRERALKEIRGMEGIRETFINDILISAKENEILKSEMEN